MKTIEIDQLQSVTGGTSAFGHCAQAVYTKAYNFSPVDSDMLTLGGARKLIGSVQRNGFHSCERAGLRNVVRNYPMTRPAHDHIQKFLNAVD